MVFLEVKNIHKKYQDTPLLSGVSFNVAQGEIACLLGASGSGKTTLLRLIAGLEAPERGSVWLDNRDLSEVPAHRRGVVLMFQEYALFPHRTVAQNVAFGLRMQRRARDAIAARVARMLDLVGLAGFEDRNVVELSGGEQQRVALARSLAPEPRLLLLDEPLGALDRNLRERLLEELPAILRQVGVTAVTVTHDQEEAFALADRVILLHEERVVQAGLPEEVYAAPANTWVARFLGLDNLITAEVCGPNTVRAPFGEVRLPATLRLPKVGTAGTLLVHPWGIRLGGAAAPERSFEAQVVRRTYHGPMYQLTLALGDIRLHLRCGLGSPIPQEKERAWLTFEPDALHWLDN